MHHIPIGNNVKYLISIKKSKRLFFLRIYRLRQLRLFANNTYYIYLTLQISNICNVSIICVVSSSLRSTLIMGERLRILYKCVHTM